MIKIALLAALLILGGCDAIPQDPEGTLERIRAEKSFRAGLVIGSGLHDRRVAALLLSRLAKRTGALPEVKTGAAETLIAELETGELDIVLGEFVAATPWSTYVTFSPPLAMRLHASNEVHTVAAMRHGENAWISLVEREARKIGGSPQ